MNRRVVALALACGLAPAAAAQSVLVIPYGGPGHIPIVGRWTGDLTTYIGVYDPAAHNFYLRIHNSPGPAEIILPAGATGDLPVAGHWCNLGGYNSRADKPGLYRPSTNTFYLRCTNEGSFTAVPMGAAGDTPLGYDFFSPSSGIGVFRPSNNTFYLRNTPSAGTPDLVTAVGAPGDLPLIPYSLIFYTINSVGQSFWTPSVYRPSTSTFYVGGEIIPFGAPGDIPLLGDWTGSGTYKVGVYRPSDNTFYLKTTFP